MENRTKVLSDLSAFYSKLYGAKLAAQQEGLNEQVMIITNRMADLSAIINNARVILSREWREDALKLHVQLNAINARIDESLSDIDEHVDVINHIASILDFIEEVIELAAKIAP